MMRQYGLALKDKKAFTLIEMIISIAIASVVLIVAFYILVGMVLSTRRENDSTHIDSELRTAMTIVEKNVSMAERGYRYNFADDDRLLLVDEKNDRELRFHVVEDTLYLNNNIISYNIDRIVVNYRMSAELVDITIVSSINSNISVSKTMLNHKGRVAH